MADQHFHAPVNVTGNNNFSTNYQFSLSLEKESEMIGTKVTPSLLKIIDQFAKSHNFTNRSLAIKTLIRIGLKFHRLQDLNFGQLAEELNKIVK